MEHIVQDCAPPLSNMSEGLAAIVVILLLIPGWAVGLGALFLYLWHRFYRSQRNSTDTESKID